MFRRTRTIMLGLYFLTVSIPAFASNAENSIMPAFNQTIDFSRLTPSGLSSAADDAIRTAGESLEKIIATPKEKRTFYNTLTALDDLYNNLSYVQNYADLLVNVHPDESIRQTAKECVTRIDKYLTALSMNERLYRAVLEYSNSSDASQLKGVREKFLDETLLEFERAGLALPADKRKTLEAIQNKLSELALAFNSNIAEYKDSLVLREEEMEGLPEDYKAAHKAADGTYVIDLSYPSYFPFMRLAKSDKARRELYVKFNNLAHDKNTALLREIIYNRKVLSYMLGYDTYAQYVLKTRMAKNPQNVWKFEEDLIAAVQNKAQNDYNELLSVKREVLNDPAVNVIQPWENAYYRNILLKNKYSVDQEKVKEYFSVNDVIDGLFKISQHLFKVQFREVPNPSVWHKDVRLFEVVENDKVISRFYFDLFPRENKYNHAGHFSLLRGKSSREGYQIPVSVLVCNFPKPGGDKPALMPHTDVTTFFHEFGHALHNMLSRSELSGFSGTAVARDFVETPSQIFENWAWNYEALSMFARHYQTREPLSKDLFGKMTAAKNVGSGLAVLNQVLYGEIDMTYHDRFNSKGQETTTDVVKNLHNRIMLFPFVDGTHFEAGFGHLTDYAAGYYGYLWAEVYAQDMFSVFEESGIMDQNTGMRFREMVLSKGSTIPEAQIVRDFLGRESNQKAFLRSLGL